MCRAKQITADFLWERGIDSVNTTQPGISFNINKVSVVQCKTEDNVYHEGRSNFKLSSDSTVLMGMSAGCNSAFPMDLISRALSSHCLDVWVCRFGVLCVLTSIMTQIWWYWWWYASSYYITLSSAGAGVKPLHAFVCGHMMLMSIWSYIYEKSFGWIY